MENASKALLIAGAVLIVILLIGIGMLIYSRSTGVIDTAASTMNTQEIQAFNSQFTPYEGEQKGSSVRALISTVIANNGTYNPSNNNIYATGNKAVAIDINGMPDGVRSNVGGDYGPGTFGYAYNITNSAKLSKLSSLIETEKTYKITISYYREGLIKHISIVEK